VEGRTRGKEGMLTLREFQEEKRFRDLRTSQMRTETGKRNRATEVLEGGGSSRETGMASGAAAPVRCKACRSGCARWPRVP